MRCRHDWEERARRFTPGKAVAKMSFEGERGADAMERLTFGFTAVELVCCKCRDVGFRTVVGDQTKADPS